MEGVNCFGKKNVQVGKYIIAVLTEILKSKCKTFLKTLRIFNYNRFPSFDWLFNWTELWPTRVERGSVYFVPDVYFLVFCSSTLFLWLLLLNDFLQRRSLRIIVKLNEHNNFASFWKFLLMSRSWLYFYDIFVIHTYTYFCDIPKHFLGFGLYGAFLCNNEGIQWGNFDTNRKVLFFFENR